MVASLGPSGETLSRLSLRFLGGIGAAGDRGGGEAAVAVAADPRLPVIVIPCPGPATGPAWSGPPASLTPVLLARLHPAPDRGGGCMMTMLPLATTDPFEANTPGPGPGVGVLELARRAKAEEK